MEYDWFWVILAVGVFTTVAIVPLELALVPHNRKRHRRIHRPSARNRRRHSPGRHADVSDSSAPTGRRPGRV
jgi:hypothetical protein